MITTLYKKRVCLHCNSRPGTRPRGLCVPCYNDRAIRDSYPCLFAYAKQYTYTFEYEGKYIPQPDAPTNAEPGTEAKIHVLQQRASRRVGLFHPLDKNWIINRFDYYGVEPETREEAVL